MQSSSTACVQMTEVSLMWDSPQARSPGGLWMGSKGAVSVYPAITARTGEFGSLDGGPAQHLHTPFWQGPQLTALRRAGLWEGRKEVVVVLRYDWCDPEEASADGGCRFTVLPACGLKQALSSSSWDQGPASKLQQGLYDAAARQRDAFMSREHPVCTHICHQVQSVSVLNSRRYSGNFTSFLKTENPGRAVTHAAPLWTWERVMMDQMPRTR